MKLKRTCLLILSLILTTLSMAQGGEDDDCLGSFQGIKDNQIIRDAFYTDIYGESPGFYQTSFLSDRNDAHKYILNKAFDGDIKTAWVEGKSDAGIGEKIVFQLNGKIRQIEIMPGLGNPDYFKMNNRVKTAQLTIYKIIRRGFSQCTEELVLGNIVLEKELHFIDEMKMQAFYLSIECSEDNLVAIFEIKEVYKGAKWDDTPISEIKLNEEISEKTFDFMHGFSERPAIAVNPLPVIDHKDGGEGLYKIVQDKPWRTKEIASLKSNSQIYVLVEKNIPSFIYKTDKVYVHSANHCPKGINEMPDKNKYLAIAKNAFKWQYNFPSPDGKYMLHIKPGESEQTISVGLVLEDKVSGEEKILFKQKYTGDWSIGVVTWANDSKSFYFDNSGGVACIWKYDLTSNELTKIVPEHTAIFPFYFQIDSKPFVAYFDDNVLKVATP